MNENRNELGLLARVQKLWEHMGQYFDHADSASIVDNFFLLSEVLREQMVLEERKYAIVGLASSRRLVERIHKIKFELLCDLTEHACVECNRHRLWFVAKQRFVCERANEHP